MLKGKKILVAGAGGLLGSTLSAALLAQGAKVLVADINLPLMNERLEQQGIDPRHADVTRLTLDLNDVASVDALFASLDDLDGAVNCSYPRNKRYGARFESVTLEALLTVTASPIPALAERSTVVPGPSPSRVSVLPSTRFSL